MFDDVFAALLETGSLNNGWQSWFVIAFVVIGIGLGGWFGYLYDGWLYAVGGAILGAPVGWIVGMLLRGVLIFGVIFLIILVAVLGFNWITDGFAG